MAERITAQKRGEYARAAEAEIMRYADNHALWHKHIHNVDLDPSQVLKCIEMDNKPFTIDVSCRRTGKTAVKEMYHCKLLATNADQELGIVAPRLDQAKVNISYITDAISRSEALSHYVSYKNGRKQMSDSQVMFYNRSKASGYGIHSQVDGGDLTCASIEEVDDMPWDRLNSNFLLMLGGARRLGADANAKNDPTIRVTGVFKGGETVEQLLDEGKYILLPKVDMHLGIAMGIVQAEFFESMRSALSPADFCRQLLCERVADGGFILRKRIRACIGNGLEANLELQEPIPGGRYHAMGDVKFGYDASGHGESGSSSKHALVVTEKVGGHLIPIFVKTWSPGTDETVVARDIVSFWRYFRPSGGIGDAFGVTMIGMVNDMLFVEGIIGIDRHSIGGGDSTASQWPNWVFSPIRFEGMVKHQMAEAVALSINAKAWAFPYVRELEEGDQAYDTRSIKNGAGLKYKAQAAHKEQLILDYSLLLKQLENIKSSPVKGGSYNSYKMIDKKIGDDLFDALMAATWCHATAGHAPPPPVVIVSGVQRQTILLPGSRMEQLNKYRG
jgi:hypothetical protein